MKRGYDNCVWACEFCGCQTNALLRRCCDKGALADMKWREGYDARHRELAALRDVVAKLAEYGETIWDETDFRLGYRKVSSALINEARRVLATLGQATNEAKGENG